MAHTYIEQTSGVDKVFFIPLPPLLWSLAIEKKNPITPTNLLLLRPKKDPSYAVLVPTQVSQKISLSTNLLTYSAHQAGVIAHPTAGWENHTTTQRIPPDSCASFLFPQLRLPEVRHKNSALIYLWI